MKPVYNLFFVISAVLLFASCKEVVITPQTIIPLYKTMEHFGGMTPAERDSVLKADSIEIDLMMQYLGQKFVWSNSIDTLSIIPTHDKIEQKKEETVQDIITINELLIQWSDSRVVRMFTPVVDSIFPSLEPLENDLGLILENLDENGIDIPQREYAAVVWANPKSIIFTDSVMLIALNHFLGEDFPGYNSIEHYFRKSKTPEQLPYAVTEALIAGKYPYEMIDKSTVLSRIMYEGALAYIKLKVVPNATLSSTLGYTSDQLVWLNNHYKEMWGIIIGKDMIYSTSADLADRLVAPAPSTSVISPEYPGRAGRYLGYRLILNYMENNAKTPITHLLSPEFYNNPSELVLAQ